MTRSVRLVRHAESLANAGARTREPGTYSLTELGLQQAEALAPRVDPPPDLIVHSPYLRARQTAAPVIRRFPTIPIEEWPVQEITYLTPARCVDTTQVERQGIAMEYWQRCDPNYVDGPGAESLAGFMQRAAALLDQLRARPERQIMVFSHAHFIVGVLWQITHPNQPLDPAAMRVFRQFLEQTEIHNCATVPLQIANDGVITIGEIRL